jgi:hypothetical protein|tara:strand:- start:1504 stop:1713 length:210 start_codon:yes stop_codon:yes gene_type:complete
MASQSVCYEGSEKPKENEGVAISTISSLHRRTHACLEQVAAQSTSVSHFDSSSATSESGPEQLYFLTLK